MALTNVQMEQKLSSLERSITGIGIVLANMQSDINSRVRNNQLALTESSIESNIDDVNDLIRDLEARFAMVKLPEETRYYLTEDEARDFRNSFSRLQAMIADVKSLYDNLVAYSASK